MSNRVRRGGTTRRGVTGRDESNSIFVRQRFLPSPRLRTRGGAVEEEKKYYGKRTRSSFIRFKKSRINDAIFPYTHTHTRARASEEDVTLCCNVTQPAWEQRRRRYCVARYPIYKRVKYVHRRKYSVAPKYPSRFWTQCFSN